MKKWVLLTAILAAGCNQSRDSAGNAIPDRFEFVSRETHGDTFFYVFKDSKTGCEFLYAEGYRKGGLEAIPGTCKAP